jgi:transposase
VSNVGLKRRKFTREFKLRVIREVEAGKSVGHVAREYTLHPTQIRKQYAARAFAGNGHADQNKARIAEVERMVGSSR